MTDESQSRTTIAKLCAAIHRIAELPQRYPAIGFADAYIRRDDVLDILDILASIAGLCPAPCLGEPLDSHDADAKG
jgi:hypothetical protein